MTRNTDAVKDRSHRAPDDDAPDPTEGVEFLDFLEIDDVETQELEEIGAVGTLSPAAAEVDVRGQAGISLPLLVRAALIADRRFGNEAEIGIAQPSKGGIPAVVIAPPDGGSRAIAVACRRVGEDGKTKTDADPLEGSDA